MKIKRKLVKSGLGYVIDKNYKPRAMTQRGALQHAKRKMPRDLKRAGFEAFVFDCGGWFRIAYGKKCVTV
jgi:hypothetical protein